MTTNNNNSRRRQNNNNDDFGQQQHQQQQQHPQEEEEQQQQQSEEEEENGTTNHDYREGTISSARFNILCTMVGGGSLSLPMAFEKSGNGFMGPLLLLLTAKVSEFCFYALIDCCRIIHPIPTLTTTTTTTSSRRRRRREQQQGQQQEEVEVVEEEVEGQEEQGDQDQEEEEDHDDDDDDDDDDNHNDDIGVGTDSFECITYETFDQSSYALTCSKGLVTAMCFFGTVAYAVLVRDMLQPITDYIVHHYVHNNNNNNNNDDGSNSSSTSGPSLANNITMWTIVVLVTPLCSLKTLSSLGNVGAASMSSILILGCCIVYKSIQCQFFTTHDDHDHDGPNDAVLFTSSSFSWSSSFDLWPTSWKELLNAFPLFVSFYVCHYNIPKVHNELRYPTKSRVTWWIQSTTWSATLFYMIMGIAGSTYGKQCTVSGHVQGNILLDFDEDDPLLFVGRLCLAVTLTLAFPLLTIPARDIVLQSLCTNKNNHPNPTETTTTSSTTVTMRRDHNNDQDDNDQQQQQQNTEGSSAFAATVAAALREPLLEHYNHDTNHHNSNNNNNNTTNTTNNNSNNNNNNNHPTKHAYSLWLRLLVAIVLFWSATAVASCVQSIDVVWDLLGSTLSILLSYILPATSYIVLVRRRRSTSSNSTSTTSTKKGPIVTAWIILLVYTPLMIVSTINAVHNVFFSSSSSSSSSSLSSLSLSSSLS